MAKLLLLLWGGLSGAFGLSTFFIARSAIFEIKGVVALVIMTVAVAGALIVNAIDKLRAVQNSGKPAG